MSKSTQNLKAKKELFKHYQKNEALIIKIVDMVERAKGLPPHVGLAIYKATSDAISSGTRMWES